MNVIAQNINKYYHAEYKWMILYKIQIDAVIQNINEGYCTEYKWLISYQNANEYYYTKYNEFYYMEPLIVYNLMYFSNGEISKKHVNTV